MSAGRLHLLCGIVMLIVSSSILTSSVSASENQEVAISTISEADRSMAQSYRAVLNAEGAGGNVSDLLVQLNNATGYLSEARMAFKDGKFKEAVRLAQLSTDVGREVESKAESLKVDALSAQENRTRWFVSGSVLGVLLVVFVSLLSFTYFKRGYYRRLLKMRPRVEQT